MSTVCKYEKQDYQHIKNVTYFSDGYKNFLSLSHHYIDFNLETRWNFSATSNRKTAFDRIGGTRKRLNEELVFKDHTITKFYQLKQLSAKL